MVHRPERSPFQLYTTRCLASTTTPLIHHAMPQSAAAFPYLSFFIAPQADVFHHDHNLSSCSSATHLSPLPLLAPTKLCHHNPLPQTAFPFASWTLEPHTLKHTLHCRHAFSSMSCPVSETRIQTHKRKHELINAIPPVTKQHHK